MTILAKLMRVFDRVLDVTVFLASVIVAVIMLGVTADVMGRYLFNKPIMGVTEITESLLLYITFLGAAWLLREQGHVKVDLLINRVSPQARAIMNLVAAILVTLISLLVTWYGAQVTIEYIRQNILTTTLLKYPLFLVLIIIPAGGLLLVVQSIRALASWRHAAPKHHGIRIVKTER